MKLPFQIVGIDHIEFLVGNAKQAAHYYQMLFGFEHVAYRGLETGEREKVSHVLRQNNICFVFSTPLMPDSPLNEHLSLHGDGIRDIAFRVNDSRTAWKHATSQGAVSIQEPETISDDHGRVVLSAIQSFGDTIHTFVERTNYRGLYMPGYVKARSLLKTRPTGLHLIDHVAASLPEGDLEKVAEWYQKVLNFHRYWTVDDKDISTEYSSLRSVVVADSDERIKMPLNEPAAGKRKSQIQEYLDYYHGPGVQHIALSSDNIVDTVRKLTKNGIEFLPIPRSYYQTLRERVGDIEENIGELAQLGILIDRDDYGYLLQLLTAPVDDRPTIIFEVVQRKGSKSFGKGNFKALYEAIAREQAKQKNP
jgi:4-hydroxyphenylpyruvate dioxygenase